MRSRIIAFYLPQYHPTPENDKFWGKGFTEWRNVAKAKPLFPGHYEPRIPADLGFYDLRIPEVREEQAELAREAGVEGFCYWHYWFGNGVETLQRPFDEVVASGSPDFPFCIGWANHSWTTKTWTKQKSNQENSCIFEMKYLGVEEYEKHFYRLLDAFKDHRYIKVEGKLLFLIFNIDDFEDFPNFKTVWNSLAVKNGLPGFYFISHTNTLPSISAHNIGKTMKLDEINNEMIDKALAKGVDGVDTLNNNYAEYKSRGLLHKIITGFSRKHLNGIIIEKYSYKSIIEHLLTDRHRSPNVFPEILVGNDRSPRAGRKAIVYTGATPENFYLCAKRTIDLVQEKDFDHRIVFLNSWNEWGEGAYMEPDIRYGKGFIHALKRAQEDNEV